MKQCPFCHEMIDEQETLCPYCGTVQDELSQPVSIEPNEGVQTDLLDENNEPTPSFTTKVETSIPEEDNNRSSQENRVKNNRLAYSGAWNKFKRFFTFFGERLVQPTNHYSRKRQYSRTYGYALIILATVMSAFVTTHLIHSLIGQYQLFADISILPSLTSTPNYIWMFIRFILFYLVFYLGFPSVSYGLKHVFQKRQHVFNYWLTQYEGMNVLAIVLLAVATVMTFISPVWLFIGILIVFFAHILLYIVTFTSSMFKSATESTIDPIYLSLLGLVVQLIITISLLLILF